MFKYLYLLTESLDLMAQHYLLIHELSTTQFVALCGTINWVYNIYIEKLLGILHNCIIEGCATMC